MKIVFSSEKTAVLGSGVMGSQIAAHLANANVDVVLFDLPGKMEIQIVSSLKVAHIFTKLEPTLFLLSLKLITLLLL